MIQLREEWIPLNINMTLAVAARVIFIFRGMKISEVKIMFLCYT